MVEGDDCSVSVLTHHHCMTVAECPPTHILPTQTNIEPCACVCIAQLESDALDATPTLWECHAHLIRGCHTHLEGEVSRLQGLQQWTNQSPSPPPTFSASPEHDSGLDVCSHSESMDRSIVQSINQPINQPINQSTNQSISQSINQPINQSINQSIQSINQSIQSIQSINQ